MPRNPMFNPGREMDINKSKYTMQSAKRQRNMAPPRRVEDFDEQPPGVKRPKFSTNEVTFHQVLENEMKILRETLKEEREKDRKCWKEEMSALATTFSAEKEKDRQYWVGQAVKHNESETKKSSRPKDGSPQPQSSCQREDGANILCGTIETQMIVKGEDEDKNYAECPKNPGHKHFIAVNEFNIKNLPKGYYDNDLVDFIKATADLTVRVEVKIASGKRPEPRQKTKRYNPIYDMRQNNNIRFGTGMLCDVENYTEGHIMAFNKGAFKCLRCRRAANYSKVWGVIRMILSTDVVFDDSEARHTTCRLFYDKPDSPVVTLDGWTVEEANAEKGWMVLKCVTCDTDLLDKLDQMWKHWRNNLLNKVNDKYKSSRDHDKLAFIVSHPHGCRKKITLGRWIKKNEVGVGWVKYTYTTWTCPGSSGAYVHLLGYNDWDYKGRIVHSGVNSEGKNFSCAGVKFD